jgi:hypothetical protein
MCFSGFYSLFSVTEEPFVTSGGEHFFVAYGFVLIFSPQDNGWDFIGKTRKTRYA